MLLSIVIVNYNVRKFLEPCLHSVRKAIDLSPVLPNQTQVVVVDNASSDGSRASLPALFPWCLFLWNAENVGFSKANNQTLSLLTGRYVLFLNPDTLITGDCLDQCITFMDTNLHAGAAGVKMLDGKGEFLPESKRGYPSAMTSFYKLSGITALLPHSKTFAKYYLGNLKDNQTQAVEILSGAFMFVRKSVLDITGGFDERFFMYAEDIDLSYRFTLAGYQNYYIASASIVHFKGESTPKDKKHKQLFYKAMLQFVEKYRKGPGSGVYLLFMKGAIRLRAMIATLHL